ncbi:RNA methyltransferase [Lampropedia puyangensis]|uniref:RNA methyltransferase n=1 Tax=Lampropedia puyangensis TaxID=1330072 RepID=A0A4S8ESU8_9BURK|nr:RNA methyltransferase [Lampropedia puyangensis]THT97832.1 RNA methyltransferase [Lampropedia puyangensis]
MKTRFILIQTSHAGNVGAVARAMRTMGFDDLVLVDPRWPDVLTHQEAIDRASGATDVLQRARVVQTLDEALDGIQHLCATAMVARDFGPPTRTPRAHFDQLKQDWGYGAEDGLNGMGMAFLFGCERYGMRNEDVYRSHVALQIPTAPDFGSLNLASAVQVIAYEWRQWLDANAADRQQTKAALPGSTRAQGIPLADAAAVAGMLEHWRCGLEAIGYLDPAAPKKLMPRLQQIFNRAQLSDPEIHLLRGIAKSMLYIAAQKSDERDGLKDSADAT